MRLVIDLQGAQSSGSRMRGIGRYSRELARAMTREARGHEVIIALNGNLPEAAEALSADFANILPRRQICVWYPPAGTAAQLDSPARGFAESLRAEFLAALQPDLIHVSSLFEGLGDDIVTLQPARLQRLPVVATCYDLIPLVRHNEYFGPQGVISHEPQSQGERWYYRCVQEMALCDGLLAISESSRGEAIRHLPYPRERVFNIQTGISPAFHPIKLSDTARTLFMQRYGLRDSFILFLGAGDIRKNEAGLIAAYARLPQTLRDRHQLVIVGRMDEAALHRTAAQWQISAENLAIIPFVQEDDLNALYSACELFVFPSLHEGFGLPAAEAMACGAATIVSNTSSLPEVMGRDDATFDPGDPADIADCMRKVLENSAFRAELAAHGPVQAARFTWPASAARAWDALEEIQARRMPREPHSRAGLLPPRPRLALVSPMPPQASGIADYSRDLLPSLARYYDITVVSEEEIGDTRLQATFPRLDPASFLRQAGQFDRVVYQIGNSTFHRFQIEELLPQCPGIVVLHDAFLSDYMNWLAHEQGRPDDFRVALWRSHGYPALLYDAKRGRAATQAHYPCCLPVLQAAIGIIQHSRHGVDVLRQHFGAVATSAPAVIPLLRVDHARPSRAAARALLGLEDDDFVVCSLGGVTALKCPDLVAEAWRRSGLTGRLVFAGGAESELQQALTDPAAGISCTGRLSREDYGAWLSASDMAVQWRKGSRGESSAAVADALMAGLPLIVNRHGSSAELPAEVAVELPDRADAQALAVAMAALQGDPARRRTLSAAARAYAQREMAPEAVARRYHDVIEQAYATPRPAVVARVLEREIQAMATMPDGLLASARATSHSFAQPWRAGGNKRLLIDMSELARRDQGSGIQRVVREIACRALETSPHGYLVEPVRFDGGRLRQTHAAPQRLLGLAPLALPETAVEAGAGDILLCADVNGELTAAEFAKLRRLRLDGMRIVLVVYDLLPLRHPELFPEPVSRLVGEWYARLLGIADAAACISYAVADELAAWLSEDPARRTAPLPIGVFHLGADFPAEGDEAPSAEAAAALASARQRPTVLMTGTVEPRKGYRQTLAAFESLWRTGAQIGLTIVGKQGWRMEDFVADLQKSPEQGDRLHWLQRCTDTELRQLYDVGKGLLMASEHEGFGLPIVEAARAQMPVMARDLPVFREVAGEHARYFSGDSPEDLAQALRGWVAAGFAPSPAGMNPLSWDDSFRDLSAIIFEEQWHRIWRP